MAKVSKESGSGLFAWDQGEQIRLTKQTTTPLSQCLLLHECFGKLCRFKK